LAPEAGYQIPALAKQMIGLQNQINARDLIAWLGGPGVLATRGEKCSGAGKDRAVEQDQASDAN
jgi:hypothetical protein